MGLSFLSFALNAQVSSGNIIYIIDSIPVIEDPEEENALDERYIADISVIKNKDTLSMLGFEKFDGAIYIFTKEYRNRPAHLREMPSSKQMEKQLEAFAQFCGRTR